MRSAQEAQAELDRKRYVAQADAWTAAQAVRLHVEPSKVLLAIRGSVLAGQLELMSRAAFVAEVAGRPTAPQDRHQIAALRKLRDFYAEPRGKSDKPLPGTMRAAIEAHHRDLEAQRREKRAAS